MTALEQMCAALSPLAGGGGRVLAALDGPCASGKTTLAGQAARQLGWEPAEIADPTATDGTWLSTMGVPVVDAMSAMAQEIHTTQEHVSLSSLCQRTALCALALRQICL